MHVPLTQGIKNQLSYSVNKEENRDVVLKRTLAKRPKDQYRVDT